MSKKPDDAAKISSLASILKVGNQQKEVSTPPPSPAPPVEAPVAEVPVTAKRTKPAKVGKSSNPSFHHYGVYLRKDTHKQVRRRLEDLELDKDVSELVQELLEQWLKAN
jgi:hypothetical protein